MAPEEIGRPTEGTEEILRTGYKLEAQSRELLDKIDEVLNRPGPVTAPSEGERADFRSSRRR